jgi:hypothetical protein
VSVGVPHGYDAVDVVIEALAGHASRLGKVHDQLALAVQAAQTVSMPRDAYGVICQFFPPMIDPLEQRGVEALASAAETMDDTSVAIGNTARVYDAVDRANARSFRGEGQ